MPHPRANDPSSIHFARQHPRRANRTHVTSYAETAQAIASMECLSAMCSSLGVTGPIVDYVYASCAVTVELDNERLGEDALLAWAASAPLYSVAFSTVPSSVDTTDMGTVTVPQGFHAMLKSPHRLHWLAAIAKELKGLIALGTWTLVLRSSIPADANVIRCHFVFALKRNFDGTVEKFKARLVADGNTQKFGVDFDRVFSTVVKPQTIRLALILAVAHDWNITSIDIRQAYLQADLDKPVYMAVPPGVTSRDNQGRPLVCKLKRSLYGLRNAGRAWANLFASFLMSWGFVRSPIDVCLFTYATQTAIIWILVWVDDAIILCTCGV